MGLLYRKNEVYSVISDGYTYTHSYIWMVMIPDVIERDERSYEQCSKSLGHSILLVGL
jgi:hypothetical protein